MPHTIGMPAGSFLAAGALALALLASAAPWTAHASPAGGEESAVPSDGTAAGSEKETAPDGARSAAAGPALRARALPLGKDAAVTGRLLARPVAAGAPRETAGDLAAPVPVRDPAAPEAEQATAPALPAEASAAGREPAGDSRRAPETDAGTPSAEAEARERLKAREREEERRYRDQLLDESIERLLPLEPDELRDFIHRRDAVEGAVEPGPATMRVGTRTLAVTPGARPPFIRLTAGYSSTILFQDATGQPWPVLSVILGNARAFQVSQPRVTPESAVEGEEESETATAGNGARRRGRAATAEGSADNAHSNLVSVVPLTNHAASNLVVTLEGAPYPVILHLLTESSAKEGRVDDALVVFRMEGNGPNARAPMLGPSLPGAVDETLLAFVHGLAPEGAARLRLSPAVPGVQAWAHEGRVYLRSRHQAVWPAWTAVAAGEGLQVYVMPKVPSVVVAVEGKRTRLALETAASAGPGGSQAAGRSSGRR